MVERLPKLFHCVLRYRWNKIRANYVWSNTRKWDRNWKFANVRFRELENLRIRQSRRFKMWRTEFWKEIWKLKKPQSRCDISNSGITCSPNSSIDRSNFRRRWFARWSFQQRIFKYPSRKGAPSSEWQLYSLKSGAVTNSKGYICTCNRRPPDALLRLFQLTGIV